MNQPNPNKALWEKGDFTRIAESMRESGETLAKSFGITKGIKVLDLGCGDGTTAIPEAKLGAEVLGVDIAKNLVDAGNKRAKDQNIENCRFQEGDASNLHELKDDSFDLTVSIFGAMFAPKPFDVAKEMVRVTRRGGAVYRILCKRVFSLKRRHAIVELNREAVQCSFPVMNGHGPFAADVV